VGESNRVAETRTVLLFSLAISIPFRLKLIPRQVFGKRKPESKLECE
jgi:hypothetical protein